MADDPSDPVRVALNDLVQLHLARWQASGYPAGYLASVRQQLDTVLHHLQTLQRKRGPSRKTLLTLAKIRQLRAEGKKWVTIDRRLGFKPGGALQMLRRAKHGGYCW